MDSDAPRAGHAAAPTPGPGDTTAALDEEWAEQYVREVSFRAGPPGRTGVELEWLVHDRRDPGRWVPPERLDAALRPLAGGLPGGGRLTREPGGQLELSSLPAATLAGCLTATAADVAALREALRAAGLALHGDGLDQRPRPPRVLHHPRYRAMEEYFDRRGPWGRVMMRASASVQVSLEAGVTADPADPLGHPARWRLAHRLGPVLVAAFANSPLWHGRPSGWVSLRQAVWARVDPPRPPPPPPDTPDPRHSWARHALDVPLLCVRRPAPATWTAPPRLSFRAWLRGRAPLTRPPTLADLDYHLSTLFPPVRPRGWLELRMIDAQPGDQWQVALAVAATLLDDPLAADAALGATAELCPRDRPDHTAVPPPDLWLRAARHGPADPVLGRAVRRCFAAVETALARRDAPPALREAVTAFADRYPRRGRCPADDQLDALRGGAPDPTRTRPPRAPRESPGCPPTRQGVRR